MKPENPHLSSPAIEGQPQVSPEAFDRLPPLKTPEGGIEHAGGDRREQAAQLATPHDQPSSVVVPVVPITPVQGDVSSTTSASPSGAPLTAADQDLIEKEWVDRAKKIISDTPNDPHMREEQVSSLQKDYLRKRYGKELGAA